MSCDTHALWLLVFDQCEPHLIIKNVLCLFVHIDNFVIHIGHIKNPRSVGVLLIIPICDIVLPLCSVDQARSKCRLQINLLCQIKRSGIKINLCLKIRACVPVQEIIQVPVCFYFCSLVRSRGVIIVGEVLIWNNFASKLQEPSIKTASCNKITHLPHLPFK
nr:MAG TPA: hypothetical protein [Caudoviricetes sp.]